MLVVRRPLPARGEHQIAHVYLPQACNGTPEHFRFALPDAEPQATNSRALLTWADAFARHVGGSAWGEFATARVRELYPEAPPKAVAAPPDASEAGRGPKAAKAKAAKAKGKTEAAAGKPSPAARTRVTPPRREPSELARLMDTTTGMTSLQETLQTDRALLAVGDEAATVPLSELKPPSFKPHPWAAMTAALARPVPSEPLAVSAPAAFYYVRFRTITQLIHLREELDAGIGPALAGIGEGADYDLGAPLRGRARPAAGTADEAARPGGGRRSRGRRQRSLPARRERPVVRVSRARAARLRGGAGGDAGGVRRRARRAEVGRRSITRERRSTSRDRSTASCAATAPPWGDSTSCRTAWRRPGA